jgi:group II intron reverse transcriptase/maturase
MLTAQKCLEIARKRGEAAQEINRVYRMLKCKELYFIAYGKLSANRGALTPGTVPDDTVDGMSVKRIDAIIDKLTTGCYEWKPSRRIYIGKSRSKSLRPLGMPSWSDKLLQEVMRMILQAYYEPQFRDCSHGFRPKRGCHTALKAISRTWTGTRWFIETDIKGCFENINHAVLLTTISKKVKDARFLKLLKGMLQVGYLEQGIRYHTYSGTPQGGILSPLLANIVLNELDVYIEDLLLPQYNQGTRKTPNPKYRRLMSLRNTAKKHRQKWRWDDAGKTLRKTPSMAGNDSEFKRLRYIRYADDAILAVDGSHEDAEKITAEIGTFLHGIGLEMSAQKTLITHAKNDKARFLNYLISVEWNDTKQTVNRRGHKSRSVNGGIHLEMPPDVYQEWKARVCGKHGKIVHRPELLYVSDYDIVATYEVELQGLLNYYAFACNVQKRGHSLRYFWQQSLAKTLAGKHRTTMPHIYKKYHDRTEKGRKTIAVVIPRAHKNPLTAIFGNKPIERKRDVVINDTIAHIHTGRTQLVERMLADTCELCGSRVDVQVHHIKKLKDLRKKWQGRKDKPEWVKKMIAIRRKTLVVCKKHHDMIHRGEYDGAKLV